MDDEEARGEAAVFASESGEAGTRRIARAVAVEQQSFPSFGRSWVPYFSRSLREVGIFGMRRK
jgi:hypothetical protein